MKIGVSSYSFSQYRRESGCSYVDICHLAKEIGFDAIEFIGLDAEDPIAEAKVIRDACAELGLEISAYTIGANLMSENFEATRAQLYRDLAIAKELGANNLGESVGEAEKATHGEEASWETIITLNPEYMFILDRSTATSASDEGVMGAREVIENELIKELDVYKNGKIVYFIEHANVWYTSTGGV